MKDLNEEVEWILPSHQPETPEQFTMFHNTKSFVVDLYPGDSLYIPALWFHEVHQSDRCIADICYKFNCIRMCSMARRKHLDDFMCCRMIGKLEEGCIVPNITQEIGTDKSVISPAWKTFQVTGTAVRKVGGGLPRKLPWIADIRLSK
ncbi:hypothetical protein AVEN_172755-1 [Araneus ventricosus]|uniref:JmjC domain-containing protein n=1 Tax=Araneus ventricosus TaxID=182803 RepID=A0A4Y2BHU2_ARAVE|nr:hypothetical protein AVEN_172755-1 [Araneus ventricosus]